MAWMCETAGRVQAQLPDRPDISQILEHYNMSIEVSEQYKIRQSVDLAALKLCKLRSSIKWKGRILESEQKKRDLKKFFEKKKNEWWLRAYFVVVTIWVTQSSSRDFFGVFLDCFLVLLFPNRNETGYTAIYIAIV